MGEIRLGGLSVADVFNENQQPTKAVSAFRGKELLASLMNK
jgi:hypothetical protein